MIELFIANEIFRVIVLFILGLCIGSFLNVVIYRLPIILERNWRNEAIDILGDDCHLSKDNQQFNLMFPASHCPSCHNKIPAWTNIPVIGYFLISGRCYSCQQKISLRYPLIELLCGILFAVVGLVFSQMWVIAGSLIFVSLLISMIFIDLDTYLLPDELTLSLLWLGLLFNLQGLFAGSLVSAAIGAMVGYVSLWLLYWGFKLLTGKDGMGYGDFKLLAALGAWLGWQHLLSILLISSILGIIYAVALRVSGKLAAGNPIPFGPFLGGAGIVVLFFAQQLFPIIIPN